MTEKLSFEPAAGSTLAHIILSTHGLSSEGNLATQHCLGVPHVVNDYALPLFRLREYMSDVVRDFSDPK